MADLDGGAARARAARGRHRLDGGRRGRRRSPTSPTEAEARAAVEDGTADAAFIIPAGLHAGDRGRPGRRRSRSSARRTRASRPRSRGRSRSGSATGSWRSSCRWRRSRTWRRRRRRRAGGASARIAADRAPPRRPPVVLVDDDGRAPPADACRPTSRPRWRSCSCSSRPRSGSSACSRSGARARSRRILAGPDPARGRSCSARRSGSFVPGVAGDDACSSSRRRCSSGRTGGRRSAWRCCVVAAIIAAIGISTLVTSFAQHGRGGGGGELGGRDHAGDPRRARSRPTAQAPEVMATLALLTPHGWFLRGLGDMQGAGHRGGRACRRSAVLLAIGLVTGAIGMRARPATGGAPDEPARQGPRRSGGSTCCARSATAPTCSSCSCCRRSSSSRWGSSSAARAGRAWASSRRPGDAAAEALVAVLARRRHPRSRSARVADEATLASQVERGQLEAGLVIPDGLRARRSRGTGTVEIRYLGTTDALTAGLRAPVEAAIARLARDHDRRAGRRGRGPGRLGRGEPRRPRPATRRARRRGRRLRGGRARDVRRASRSSRSARPTQLILFMFLTSMTAAGRLVYTKQLGVSRRMVVDPDLGLDDRRRRGARAGTSWRCSRRRTSWW